jgi:Na+-translocating ferredoxin:NAD+ oxidoreductase RnfG subunit
MQKIKDFFMSIISYIILGVVAVIGFLLYSLSNKKNEVNALKAKIDLADTQKKADLLEVEIKQRLENKQLLQKEVDELNKNLVLLAEKRAQIAKQEAGKTPEEVEDFWNKG